MGKYLIMIFDTIHYLVPTSTLQEFLDIKHGKKLIFQHGIYLPLKNSIYCGNSQGLFNVSLIGESWFDLLGWLNNQVEY